MTREELKVHCEKQIKQCEMWAKHNGEEPGGKIYEEHKLILELLDQEPSSDMVSRGVFEQIMWERDVAIEQLKALGYELGQKVEPCEDAISRQAVLDCLTATNLKKFDFILDARDKIKNLPTVNPQEPKTEQFAKWVAEEIFDENWEYNKDAFAELACRKLAKLGIVRAKGDVWELIGVQESEE